MRMVSLSDHWVCAVGRPLQTISPPKQLAGSFTVCSHVKNSYLLDNLFVILVPNYLDKFQNTLNTMRQRKREMVASF